MEAAKKSKVCDLFMSSVATRKRGKWRRAQDNVERLVESLLGRIDGDGQLGGLEPMLQRPDGEVHHALAHIGEYESAPG